MEKNMINTKCFDGQICTDNYDELVDWVMKQPEPNQLALKWFIEWAKHNMTDRIGSHETSYTLKHCVEGLSKWAKINHPNYMYEYIGNEDLICAMVRAGFKARNSNPRNSLPGPNYYFNLKKLHAGWIEEIIPARNIVEKGSSNV